MHFYHSFPRRGKNTPAEVAAGMVILSSILEFGLLLTPEELEVPPNPYSDREKPPMTRVDQYRACFTLIGRDELLQAEGHTKLFGRFSIGLDSYVARKLGIVPTIYYYKSKNYGNPLSEDAGISEEVLYRLTEIRQILVVLAHLEASSNKNLDRYKPLRYLMEAGFVLDQEPDVQSALSKVPERLASGIVELFDTDRVAAWNLAEWVEIILSMFQTADSSFSQRHLAYYSQREWRIIQFYASGFWCIPLADDKLRRLPINLKMQASVARRAKRTMKNTGLLHQDLRFKSSYLLHGYDKLLFRDFIEEIIVPECVTEETKSLLQKYKMIYRNQSFSNGKEAFTVFQVEASRIPRAWRLA